MCKKNVCMVRRIGYPWAVHVAEAGHLRCFTFMLSFLLSFSTVYSETVFCSGESFQGIPSLVYGELFQAIDRISVELILLFMYWKFSGLRRLRERCEKGAGWNLNFSIRTSSTLYLLGFSMNSFHILHEEWELFLASPHYLFWKEILVFLSFMRYFNGSQMRWKSTFAVALLLSDVAFPTSCWKCFWKRQLFSWKKTTRMKEIRPIRKDGNKVYPGSFARISVMSLSSEFSHPSVVYDATEGECSIKRTHSLVRRCHVKLTEAAVLRQLKTIQEEWRLDHVMYSC